MRILLDTNVIIELSRSPEVLRSDVVELLAADATTPVVSVIVAWEIAIKWRLGKVTLPEPPSLRGRSPHPHSADGRSALMR